MVEFEKSFSEKDWMDTSARWSSDNGDKTLRLDYPLTDKSVIVDIGGYIGKWASEIYCKYGCRLYVYEPVKAFAADIRNKFEKNARVKVFDYGIAHINTQAEISVIAESSSLFKGGADVESVYLREGAEVLTEVMKDAGVKRIDIVKVNIEGAEFSLLEHFIDTGIISKILNLQVQFHIFVKNYEYKRDSLREKLSKTHELTYDYPFIWENWKIKPPVEIMSDKLVIVKTESDKI